MRTATLSLSLVLAITPLVSINAQTLDRATHDGNYLTPSSFLVPAGPSGLVWDYTFSQPSANWVQSSFNTSGWSQGTGGFYFGSTMEGDNEGTVWSQGASDLWARSTFTVSADAASKLMFWGRWDDRLTIYINGVEAVSFKSWASSYRYLGISQAARDAIVANAPNIIAVHVEDTGGGRYFDLGIVEAEPLVQLPVDGYAKNAHFDIITEHVSEAMSQYGVSAGAISVGRGMGADAEIVLSQGIGYMDKNFSRAVPREAVFRLASLDKMPTKDAIHKLISDAATHPITGEVLTESTQVFPFLASAGLQPLSSGIADSQINDITIRHLLDHESGVPPIPEKDGLEAFYSSLGKTSDTVTAEDNVRWLYSQNLEHPPGSPTSPDPYSSSGYMLLRFVVETLSLDIESYLRNELLADASDDSMYIAHERINGRRNDAQGNLLEPWYSTFEEPYARWINLENYTALASTADAYTEYQQHNAGAGRFYGGMAGSQTMTEKFTAPDGQIISYSVFFNACCVIPTRETVNGVQHKNFDGTLRELLESLPAAAWSSTGSDLVCNLANSQIGNGGFGVYSATVTNTGSQPVNGWDVNIDFDTATPDVSWSWGATATEAGNSVTISGSNTLQPGQSVSFGIGGNYSGQAPQALTCL